MTDDHHTLGGRLSSLKERAGLSLDQIAKAAGYRGRSSIQRYFNAGFDDDFLHPSVLAKLTDALLGKGSPPITAEDLNYLSYGFFKDSKVLSNVPLEGELPIDKLARYDDFLEGDAGLIDLFEVKPGNRSFTRTDDWLTKTLIALEINVSAMYPRYKMGEIALFNIARVATVGDDALILLSAGNVGPLITAFGYIESVNDESVFIRQYMRGEGMTVPRRLIIDMFPSVRLDQLLQVRRLSTKDDLHLNAVRK